MRRWPDTLPAMSYPGADLSPVDQSIRTEMEVGAAKLRRITRARRDTQAVEWRMKDAEFYLFRRWHEDAAWSIAGDSDDLTGWTGSAATLTAAAALGPGGQPVTAIAEDSATSGHLAALALGAEATADAVLYLCAALKANGRTAARLQFVSRANVARYVEVDLSAGTVTASAGVASPAIAARGDGWYRVSFLAAVDSGATAPSIAIHLMAPGLSYAGDGSSGVLAGEVTLRIADGLDGFLPTGADGLVQGAAGGSAWFATELALGGGITAVEARFTGPYSARPGSGLLWTVTARLEARDA